MSVTDNLRDFLLRERGVSLPEGGSIEIDQVYMHATQHNFQNGSNPEKCVDVAQLLDESKIVYRTKSPESGTNLTEIERMRARAEERKYQKTISGFSLPRNTGAGSDVKSATESLSFATHFILAFISAFLVGYYLGEYVFELQRKDYKYILGGACSFGTLILESLLFIIREEKKQMVESKRSPALPKAHEKSPSVPPVASTSVSELAGKDVSSAPSVRKRVKQ